MQSRYLIKNHNNFFKLLKPKFKLLHNDSDNHVCFIGFQGSNMKKIRKHINIYKKNNYSMTIYTPNYLQNYNQDYVYNASYKLNSIIKEQNKKTTFHVISGGAYPMSVVLNQLILDDNLHLIKNIIYDASPVSCNFCSGLRALNITNNYKIPNFILNKFLSMYLLTARLPMDTWCQGFYNTLNSPLLNDKNKLFLVSKKDPLIPFNETQEFLSHQKNYQIVEFNSEHGKNILTDPELYENTINNFLKNN